VLEGPHTRGFIEVAAKALASKGAQTMLTAGIAAAYKDGVAQRAANHGVQSLAQGTSTDATCAALPVLFETTAAKFLATAQLEGEIFGPTSLIVTCADIGEMLKVAEHLEGQLTATLQLEADDYALARQLLPDSRERFSDRRRSLLRNGARRPVPGHFRWTRHVGGRNRDRALPASGLLSGSAGRVVARGAARRQPAEALASA
jgi:hypothetical protein